MKRGFYMSKEWIKIDTIYSTTKPKTREERAKQARAFKRLMAKTEKLSAADLKKASNEYYAEQKLKNDCLLQAYEDKRLKSKEAIKQAIRIKKEREKKHNDAKQDTKKVSNVKETTESTV